MASESGRVSVIIGLYNVERFLSEKRLSCILNQTWRDMEIILVNDGSTDRTLELCRELASEDSRIVLVDKPNGGLGSARNAGLDAAGGDFVWFYDVDDDAEPGLVEKNISWMKELRTDMNIFGIRFNYPATGRTETSQFKERLIESNEELKSVFMDGLFLVPNGNGFAWNKFYRRDFLDRTGVRFGEQRIQQDEVFNLRLYPLASRVYVSPELLYNYNIYDSGNTRSRYIPDRISAYESVFDGILSFGKEWNLQDPRLERHAYRRFYQGIDNSVRFNAFHPDAPRSLRWKREEVSHILSRPAVRRCLEYAGNAFRFNTEGKLFLDAYRSNNFAAILIYRALFGSLRRLKHLGR